MEKESIFITLKRSQPLQLIDGYDFFFSVKNKTLNLDEDKNILYRIRIQTTVVSFRHIFLDLAIM